MNSFDKISADLREAMGKNPAFSILLGIGAILMYVGAGMTLFDSIFGYSKIFGSWLVSICYAVDFWLFVFGALGAYAAGKTQALAIGFSLMTLSLLWDFVDWLIPREYRSSIFSWSTFVSLLIYGAVTYFLLKKTFLKDVLTKK